MKINKAITSTVLSKLHADSKIWIPMKPKSVDGIEFIKYGKNYLCGIHVNGYPDMDGYYFPLGTVPSREISNVIFTAIRSKTTRGIEINSENKTDLEILRSYALKAVHTSAPAYRYRR